MIKNKLIRIISLVLILCLLLSMTVMADTVDDTVTSQAPSSTSEIPLENSLADDSVVAEVGGETSEEKNSIDKSSSSEEPLSENSTSEEGLVSEFMPDDKFVISVNRDGLDLEEKILQTNDTTKVSLRYSTHEKYMSGYEDGTFRPNNQMTRAEFSALLYNLLDNPLDPVENKFTDVTTGAWYTKAVNSLAAAAILSGDGNGKFRPADSISRAEVVTVLAILTNSSTAADNKFSDVKTDHWAYKHIMTAIASSWVSGYTDGTFRPNAGIKRCEVPVILNAILKRRDDSFAKDAKVENKQFFDVTSGHWAHSDIMEAGQRVENPIISEKKTIKTITGVNFREGPSTDTRIVTTLPTNTFLTVIDNTSYGKWIKSSHASYGTGYIHSDYIVYEDGNNANSGDGVLSTTSANIALYKTMYVSGSISGSTQSWTSDNPSVAEVFVKSEDKSKAFIYAKSSGTTSIRLRDSAGNVKSSCTVTVTDSEPVRFVYSNPNTPSVGKDFKLYAVTDTSKSGVKFEVSGPASGSYETSTYNVESKAASTVTPSIPANSVRIFERALNFSIPGEYTVKAYAKLSNGSWSASYKSFTLIVISDQNITTTSTAKRSASHEIMSVIANFEGKGKNPGEIYIDTLSSGYVPTVGYGYVVPKNGTFYNNVTDTEMFAMLSDTIDNGAYVKNLRTFQNSYNVKMSQVQFDAMVSFGYNLGTGYFTDGSNDTFTIFLNSMTTPSLPANANVNNGTPTIYKQASIGDSDGTIPSGTTVSVVEVKRIDGNVDNLWYKVSYNGKTGWVRGGHLRFSNTTTRDLAYIDEQLFGSNLLQWNSAGGTKLPGLVYRRLGEAKIFCYGNYTDSYSSSSSYRKNVGFDVPAGVPGLSLN